MKFPLPVSKLFTARDGQEPSSFCMFLLLAFFIAVVAGLIIRVGPLINTLFWIDTVLLMDGGWRVLCGQIPHGDFHSGLGLLTFVFIALSMKWVGLSLWSITVMNCFFFVLITLWAWIIAIRRMHSLIALLFSISVGAFIAGTYHLGFQYQVATYSNLYNRYGYALLFIALCEQVFPPRKKTAFDEVAGGLSTGIIITALFFVKATYSTVAALFICMRIWMRGASRQWLIGAATGALLCLLPILVFIRFNIMAVLRDYGMMSKVRGEAVFQADTLYKSLMHHLAPCVYLFVSWLFVPAFSGEGEEKRLSKNSLSLLLVGALLSAHFLNITNFSFNYVDLPLYAFISFVPLEYFLRRSTLTERKAGRVFAILIVLFALSSGMFIVKNLQSLKYSLELKAEFLERLPKIESAPLCNFYVFCGGDHDPERFTEIVKDIPDSDYPARLILYDMRSYAAIVNDGLALLRKHTDSDSRIAALWFDNPFPLALGLKSPLHQSIFYQYQYNFNDRVHWQPEELFSDTTHIMVKIEADSNSTAPLARLYGSYIKSHYEQTDKSARWALFTLRKK
ncbi:MAG: hypothetical protein RDV48_20880 [Candidatus Eremiobacteraeota bacterium]|nr:hypothetical protein [Candidatus Eremiobacteraeota bacterium]